MISRYPLVALVTGGDIDPASVRHVTDVRDPTPRQAPRSRKYPTSPIMPGRYGCRSSDLPHVVHRGLRGANEGDAQSHIQRRQALAKRSMFVGMDVHKEAMDISTAEEGREGEVRHTAIEGAIRLLDRAGFRENSVVPSRSADRRIF